MQTTRAIPAGALAATLVVAVLLTGCDSSSTRTSPTTSPSPSLTTAAIAIPSDFPLAQGLDERYEQITGPASDAPRIRLGSVCGLRDWSKRARDRLTVQAVGPEASETRELAVFHSPATARAAMSRVANAVDQCPRQTGVPAAKASRFTLFDTPSQTAGRPVTAFAETLAGNRPGGAVYAFTRVGRAVLATSQGGEWTRESTQNGVHQLAAEDRDLITAMRTFAPRPR